MFAPSIKVAAAKSGSQTGSVRARKSPHAGAGRWRDYAEEAAVARHGYSTIPLSAGGRAPVVAANESAFGEPSGADQAIPQGPGKTVEPPILKGISVDVVGPVKAEASSAITPHLHLGDKGVTSGVNFGGAVTGGNNIGGEIFFSQVIRNSERRLRMGKMGSTETIKDLLDGGQMYKTTTMAVIPGGVTGMTETDTPGQGDSRLSDANNLGRASIRIKDEFELFLMWRASPSDPASAWLSYGSVPWLWDAAATGLTAAGPTQTPWIAPREAFDKTRGITLGGSLNLVNRKPTAAPHLSLPVNQSGNVPVPSLTEIFPDAEAKDPDMEPGTP